MTDPAYRILPLRQPAGHPAYHPFLLHFTGRTGQSLCNDQAILAMGPGQRLTEILRSRTIRAFPVFGVTESVRAVCFTESAAPEAEWLLGRGQRYSPWALAFTKDTVFGRGGGPAIEVRGDEWDLIDSLPDRLKVRAKRLWPGAEMGSFDPFVFAMEHRLSSRSEWSHEREWRLPVEGTEMTFTPEEVQFLVCPSVAERDRIAAELRHAGAVEMSTAIRRCSLVTWGPSHPSPRGHVARTRQVQWV